MNTTSVTNITGWAPDAANVPVEREDADRVAAFIAAHKLEKWVELAVRLARESFPRAKKITLSVLGGPGDEEFGERLFVEVITDATGDELARQYNGYVRRWIDATPPWVTDLMGISTRPE